MADIWIRAYGGTGNLMARAFVNLMILSPLKDTAAKIKIFLMDYDDAVVEGNDNSELQNLVQFYNDLHNMKLKGMAANEIELITGKLPIVRRGTYDVSPSHEFSLSSLFGEDKSDILRSCLTSAQIGASNQKGNYGDLARNSVIAKPMEISGKFDDTYESFNLASTIAFFLGSTDGGVANTVLDRDLYALCNYITANGGTLGNARGYRLYSVRSLPYKKHATNSSEARVQADAERILKQMVAQSMGVIGNIKRKTNYVKSGNQTTDYILDALFLAGYNVPNSGAFSDTNRYIGDIKEAHTENQSHMSHGTEMVAALMMIDVLNYSLPTSNGNKAIYAYNAEESANNKGILSSADLFSPFKTSFPCERTSTLRMDALELDIGTKIRNAIHMYAFLIQFQSDLIAASNEKETAFKGRGSLRTVPEIEALLKGIYDKGFMKAGVIKWDQVGEIAANFDSLMNALKELTKFIYEVQKNTVFGNTDPVLKILPHEALEKLVVPEEGTTYRYSKQSLWALNGTISDYKGIVSMLSKDSTLVNISKTGGSMRTTDDATAVLLNYVYQTLHRQL